MDGGRTQLFEYDRDTGEVRKLTHGPKLHLEGDYGPQGRLAVAWVDVAASPPAAGVEIRPPTGGLGENVVEGVYPMGVRWSPRGNQILYVLAQMDGRRAQAGQNAAAIVTQAPVAGAERRPLTRGRDAVYTPDGEWIVFTAFTDGGWRLRRMRSDGSGRATIGASSRDEFNPTVSPDGKHVVYVAEDGGIDRLFLRRMDGSGDRVLWADGGAAFPVW
jgi:Tol biopolymer transport system component